MIESNMTFIIAAYSVSWIVVLGYLTRLVLRGSRARTDYDRMARENSETGR